MNLSLKDRIIILNLLPEKGDYTSLVVKRDLIEKIRITQEEITKYEIKESPAGLTWKNEKEEEKEIKLTALEEKMIKESFQEKDKEKELVQDMLDTFEKFN